MAEKKTIGCLPFIAIIAVFIVFCLIWEHVNDEMQKLDSFTYFIIGTIIMGLAGIAVYFFSSRK